MVLNIFGIRVVVSPKKNLMNEHGCRGIYYPGSGKMIIDPLLVGKDKLQCVLHETVHAVICRVGIDQTKMSSDLEEILCESISIALVENWKKLNQVLAP